MKTKTREGDGLVALLLLTVGTCRLIEEIFEFLRSNYFINTASCLSRRMGRSRTYLSCLRYTGHEPSKEAYNKLAGFMRECLGEATDMDLKRCLQHYIKRVEGGSQKSENSS